jgi:hypothetical protein
MYLSILIKTIIIIIIIKMGDNFELRYVFTYPGIIIRADLVPSNGASRRRLGDQCLENISEGLLNACISRKFYILYKFCFYSFI